MQLHFLALVLSLLRQRMENGIIFVHVILRPSSALVRSATLVDEWTELFHRFCSLMYRILRMRYYSDEYCVLVAPTARLHGQQQSHVDIHFCPNIIKRHKRAQTDGPFQRTCSCILTIWCRLCRPPNSLQSFVLCLWAMGNNNCWWTRVCVQESLTNAPNSLSLDKFSELYIWPNAVFALFTLQPNK